MNEFEARKIIWLFLCEIDILVSDEALHEVGLERNEIKDAGKIMFKDKGEL